MGQSERSNLLIHEKEIVWFDVGMNDLAAMQGVDNSQHLLGKDHDQIFVQIATGIGFHYVAHTQ